MWPQHFWKDSFLNSYWISTWQKGTNSNVISAITLLHKNNIWKLILKQFMKERNQTSTQFAITLLRKNNTWKLILNQFMKERKPPDDLNSQSSKALDFVWITLLSPFLLHALSSDWRNDSAQKTESSLAVAQHKSMDSKLSILQSCSDGYFNNTYSSVILLLVLLQPKLLL